MKPLHFQVWVDESNYFWVRIYKTYESMTKAANKKFGFGDDPDYAGMFVRHSCTARPEEFGTILLNRQDLNPWTVGHELIHALSWYAKGKKWRVLHFSSAGDAGIPAMQRKITDQERFATIYGDCLKVITKKIW